MIRDFLRWRLAALKNGFQDATAYRVEFFLEVIGSAAVPAGIQILLWYAMFKGDGTTQVGGMSFTDLMNYTLASVLFSQIRGGNHDFELAEMIRSGQLSQYLLRPINCIEFVYVRGVAPKIFLATLCLCVGLVISIWTEISPLRIIGAMGLALIGNIIHYLVGAALAAVAFYWEEAYSILMVKNMIVSILCGDLLPLSLFPSSMSWLWKYTPFYLYVYGPAQYALGKWSHQEFLYNCSIGALWVVALVFVVRASWAMGEKKYVSIGG